MSKGSISEVSESNDVVNLVVEVVGDLVQHAVHVASCSPAFIMCFTVLGK